MSKAASPAESLLDEMKHSRRAEIDLVRQIIVEAEPGLDEGVKWNAPSYAFRGQDRITFRLRPGERLQLVFHRGSKAKDASEFAFEDTDALLEWAAPDRGILTLASMVEIENKKDAIGHLVRGWIRATTE